MKKNGAARTEEIADAKALATILGLTMGELGSRAIRNELKACEAAPTVQAAITALRSARESIRRKQAVKEGKA